MWIVLFTLFPTAVCPLQRQCLADPWSCTCDVFAIVASLSSGRASFVPAVRAPRRQFRSYARHAWEIKRPVCTWNSIKIFNLLFLAIISKATLIYHCHISHKSLASFDHKWKDIGYGRKLLSNRIYLVFKSAPISLQQFTVLILLFKSAAIESGKL